MAQFGSPEKEESKDSLVKDKSKIFSFDESDEQLRQDDTAKEVGHHTKKVQRRSSSLHQVVKSHYGNITKIKSDNSVVLGKPLKSALKRKPILQSRASSTNKLLVATANLVLG